MRLIHYERFQSLAKEIVDNGGEAALVRVKDIEGTPYAAVVAMFDEARARDYDEIAEPLTLLIKDARGRKTSPETFTSQLQKLRQRFQDICDIDFFQSSRGEDLERLFRRAESLQANSTSTQPHYYTTTQVHTMSKPKPNFLATALKQQAIGDPEAAVTSERPQPPARNGPPAKVE